MKIEPILSEDYPDGEPVFTMGSATLGRERDTTLQSLTPVQRKFMECVLRHELIRASRLAFETGMNQEAVTAVAAELERVNVLERLMPEGRLVIALRAARRYQEATIHSTLDRVAADAAWVDHQAVRAVDDEIARWERVKSERPSPLLDARLAGLRRERQVLVKQQKATRQESLAALAAERPLPALRRQEQAILQCLRDMGHDPKALPPPNPGKSGIKAAVRSQLRTTDLFQTDTVFHKAWERVLSDTSIVYRNEGPTSRAKKRK